ncbi:MAG: radical SAM protein [Nitrospinae bacterium]|nr:radical SAM protein [Nitrospinota bacterium]
MPALGLLYLAGYLERENISSDIVDFQATLVPWDKIDDKIKTLEYDFFGITATTPLVVNAYKIADIIKKHHPLAKVVLGGVHPTALPDEALSYPSVDYVVRGDGEEPFLNLVKGTPPDQISGISYRDSGQVKHIGEPGYVKNLDSLPTPAFHKIDFSLYHPAVGAYKRLPAINMTATRGCPGKCTFCNSASTKLRHRSAEHIFAEMEILSKKYGMREICFYDDTFTVYPENIKRLCELIIANKLDITWSCFARTDCVTAEMLGMMKKAGCHQVMYGIEAYNEKILKNIKKTISYEKNANAIKMAQKVGITVRCTFMFGNPGETIETMDETIQYAIKLNPDIALFNITIPFPGTEMYEWAKSKGYLTTYDWMEYDLSEPVMILPGLTRDSMKKKYKEAFFKYYLRPLYILRQMRRFASPSELPLLIGALKSMFRFFRSA